MNTADAIRSALQKHAAELPDVALLDRFARMPPIPWQTPITVILTTFDAVPLPCKTYVIDQTAGVIEWTAAAVYRYCA